MSILRHKNDGHRGTSKTPINPRMVPLSTGVDPARPDEIVGAKLDGVCPRCESKGDFGDEGLCLKCGFAY